MKKLFLFSFILASFSAHAQTIETYFESIRNNPAQLTAFFTQMPKGGDLHNHYSGSIYAETYIDYVVQKNYAINENTLEVRIAAPKDRNGKILPGWVYFTALDKNGSLDSYKYKLMQKWSIKDYNGISKSSDKQFFETFLAFDVAIRTQESIDTGVLELKRRAQIENVSYIETQFRLVPCDVKLDASYNKQLIQAGQSRDEAKTAALLEKLYQQLIAQKALTCASEFNTNVENMHNRLHIDDAAFTMRYQNFVLRTIPPADVFQSLIVAFASANTSPLIVGVNIVAPEGSEISLRDYWLHMQMYKFCHNKFPYVKYAMHAGELTLGMVKPEELSWHINEAVRTAGAVRIGHGVDMPYEARSYDLLSYMVKKNIAIEINLYSNEFILKVKGNDHPLSLYRSFNVPIVICSDDAGVFRSNLTHQFVILANRYKDVSYRQIKEYMYNSIDYSLIKEQSIKDKLRSQLTEDIRAFERKVLATH